MPAGVSWGTYLKFSAASMFSMFAGAQVVHWYYNPLKDLEDYVEEVRKRHVAPPPANAESNS